MNLKNISRPFLFPCLLVCLHDIVNLSVDVCGSPALDSDVSSELNCSKHESLKTEVRMSASCLYLILVYLAFKNFFS